MPPVRHDRAMPSRTSSFQSSKRTASEAIQLIAKGKHIFIGSGAAEPVALVEELVRQEHRFFDNPIVHLLTLGPAPYVEAKYVDRFRHNAFFIGPNVRAAVHDGRADYTPVFLSRIPELIRRRRLPIDVALVQTSPPDRFGYVNLGVSVDIVRAAVEAADLVIAEVNPQMPVLFGSGYVASPAIDAWIERDVPLPTLEREPPDEVATEIGRLVATLVEDRSTLQIGIGQIPDAVSRALIQKKDLSVWTEMLTDGLVDLIENGNVTGRHATLRPHKAVASFTFGTKHTYDFIDRNPTFEFHPSDEVNDPVHISRQHQMVAINGALEIDLTGQVCSDSIGSRFYSGIGGQVDFIRGASMCPGGRPIIALRSTAKKGEVSRIVATLSEGAGVVTSRGDVHYVVTEFGIADLYGKTVRERAMALIAIAHPEHRSELLAAAKGRRYVFADQFQPRRTRAGLHRKRIEDSEGREVLLRPVEVTDEQKMSDFFYSLSEETIYRRWMSSFVAMPHRKLQRYLDVDDTDNVALVVEESLEDEEPELVGVGRYHRDLATGFADAAFVVKDGWQNKGIGTALLEHLVTVARRNEVRGFTADVLASNAPMMRVFHKLGFPVQSRLEGTAYALTIPFVDSGSTGNGSGAADPA